MTFPGTDGYPDFRGGGGKFYDCTSCHREIKFSHVEYMTEIHNNAFSLTYLCDCSPGHLYERFFRVEHDALKRMLGPTRPVLPYRAAPGVARPLTRAKERVLAVFAWECQQLESVEEFELLATRPPRPQE